MCSFILNHLHLVTSVSERIVIEIERHDFMFSTPGESFDLFYQQGCIIFTVRSK
jgi:hypothetical protein